MPTADTTDVEDLRQLSNLPRSERVETLFDFTPTDYQAELLDHHDNQEKTEAAVKPGRQVGKTLSGGVVAADYVTTNSDVDAMILAPFEDTAKEMMTAATEYLSRADEKFSGVGVPFGIEDDNTTEWTLSNGSRLRMRTVGTEGTQIRGKNPSCVLVDEAAYVKDSIYDNVIEEFFITHSEYEYYLFSTPAGKSGYFYEKVEHDDRWFSPHWPTTISPYADEEFLERKREEKDSITFAQEYLGEFVDESDAYFPYDLVKACINPDTTPESGAARYLGVDVARQGRDRTVYYDLDENGTTRNIWSEETSTMPGVVGRIKNLHEEYDYEQILIDENAVGGGVVDFSKEGLGSVIEPVPFTLKNKHEMYTRLKKDFEAEALSIPNHRRLVDELTGLQFSFTSGGKLKVSHPDGGHDDHPDALALANHGRTGRSVEVTRRKPGSRSRRKIQK